jgi:hypothetical protein
MIYLERKSWDLEFKELKFTEVVPHGIIVNGFSFESDLYSMIYLEWQVLEFGI